MQTNVAQTVCQRISIPAYFYPGSLWTQAINAAPKVDFMIINPASGSGTSSNSDYQITVNQARQNGIKIYGYVYTKYGNRPQSEVTQEITNYRNWYQVDGIFLDEVSASVSFINYYQTLATFIRTQPNAKVVLNPGTFPAEQYMTIGDVVVVFENKLKPYMNLETPAWVANYSPNKFWHIVYNVPNWQLNQVVNLSQQRRAGHIYITDDRLANPYDTLPRYLNRFLTQIPQSCP